MEMHRVSTTEGLRPQDAQPNADEFKNPNNRWLVKAVHHWPTRAICIATVIVQAASLDFYLASHLGDDWLGVIAGDVIVCLVLVAAIVLAQRNIKHEKEKGANLTADDSKVLHLCYIGWLCYAILLNVKIAVIFTEFSHDLKEHAFFGVNTLKTTIALDGIIFVTFLASQHNALLGTPRRAFIQELTSSVLFDVLDAVDGLDILLDKAARSVLFPGLANTIITICCISFILPVVPLFTLAITRFGLKEVGEKPILIHKMSVGYAINLPLFIIRMIVWHGVKEGVSVFALKNLIIMGVQTAIVLEHVFCKKPKLQPQPVLTGDNQRL